MTAPIEITVKRHRCPHCGRSWHARARAVNHMGLCWNNPANRGCKTCKHFAPNDGDVETGVEDPEHCQLGLPLVSPCAAWCTTVCVDCPGRSGPVTNCELWEASQ